MKNRKLLTKDANANAAYLFCKNFLIKISTAKEPTNANGNIINEKIIATRILLIKIPKENNMLLLNSSQILVSTPGGYLILKTSGVVITK